MHDIAVPRLAIQETFAGYAARRHASLVAEGSAHSFATTQIVLPKKLADVSLAWCESHVAEEDLYMGNDDPSYGNGRETYPHVTVLYGLEEPKPTKATRDIIASFPPLTIEIQHLGLFKRPEKGYWVLKAAIGGRELHRLHQALREARPNQYSFPTYRPHMTLAYIKPEVEIPKSRFPLSGTTFTVDAIEFCGRDDVKVSLPLGG